MKEFGPLVWFFIFALIGGLATAFQKKPDSVTAPGRKLHAKFAFLDNVVGKTTEEIISVVGNPSSVSSVADGKTLMQWQATGCHMALLFNGKICEGYTHQYLANDE